MGIGSVAEQSDPTEPTALEALRPLGESSIEIATSDTTRLTHREIYTTRGLLTLLVHEPAREVTHDLTNERRGAPARAAVVAGGGAMGGLLGPGHGLYHRLGEAWAARGVRFVRIDYREPNNLDLCAHDLACGVETARDAGSERVVLMGHSFGGAAAIRAAVVMPASVVGVVTFATQSAGCEVAGALHGRPLLLFHGDRDELLPAEASYMVQAIAGSGEVVILPGDGHLLGRSDDAIVDRLDEWLPNVLALT